MALAAPWYVHPVRRTHWEWLRGADIGIAVLNVQDGPGDQIEPSYQDAVSGSFRPRVLGYVDPPMGADPCGMSSAMPNAGANGMG